MSTREEQLDIFKEVLRIPSISAKHTGIEETATYLRDLLNSKGIKATIMQTAGNPVVYGEYNIGAERTLLVYNHYDVQPVEPLSEWKHDPFIPEIVDGRLFARGSSDNKGTMLSRIFGIEEAIKNNELNVNLKFIYEGEEEIGSPSLHEFVHGHKELLKADAVIMEGSFMGEDGRPEVTLGIKGLLYIEMTSETGTSDLHSSNATIAPNPAWNLVHALNDIYDGNRVLIPGFYDDVSDLTEKQESILKGYPFEEEKMKKSLGLKKFRFNGSEKLVRELFTSPTCNIDGIVSGYTGEGSKTVTPRKATVKVDFRLVPDQDPMKIFNSLEKYLNEKGHDVEVKHYGLEHAVRTDPDTNLIRAMVVSAEKTYGKDAIIMINSPATQPMAVFSRELGIMESVSAIAARDQYSNGHAPNESVDLEYFYRAIEHTREFLKTFR